VLLRKFCEWRSTGIEETLLVTEGIYSMIQSRFEIAATKPINTPSAFNAHLSVAFAPKPSEEKEYMTRVPYASAVES